MVYYKNARQEAGVKQTIPAIPLEELTLVGTSDCAWGNARGGGSQGGRMVLVTERALLRGEEARFGPVGWNHNGSSAS